MILLWKCSDWPKEAENYKLELGTLDKFSKTDNYLIITKKTLRLAAY